MTDLRTRQLDRAARRGDAQDEARALLERVRCGALPRDRLELAAYCGHGGAPLATGVGPMPWPVRDTWVLCLGGKPGALLAAALAASEPCIRKALRACAGPCGQSMHVMRRLAEERDRFKRMAESVRVAWAGMSARGAFQVDGLRAWCLAYHRATVGGGFPPDWLVSPDDEATVLRARISAAASYVGDLPLRRAWSSRMAAWALGAA